MKKNRTISIVITLLVVIIFIGYFFANIREFEALLSVHPFYLVLIAIGHLVVLFMNGIFLRLILRSFQKDMSTAESFRASMVTATGNLFLPAGGGSGVQAIFLKKNHSLSYKNFISALSGNYIIVFLINALLGLITLTLINTAHTFEYYTILFMFGGIFLTTTYLTIFGLPKKLAEQSSNKIKEGFFSKTIFTLKDIVNGWNLIISSRKLIVSLTILTLINFLASLLISYASLASVGAHITLVGLSLYTILGAMSLLINLTPGALGIKEVIYIFSSSIIGITTPQIIGAAILDRGVKYIILILGWGWVRITSLKRNKGFREISK